MDAYVRYFSALFLILLVLSVPHEALALKDEGIAFNIGGMYNVDNPTVSVYQGRRIMWMSGAQTSANLGTGGIYVSRQEDEQIWSAPQLALYKEDYILSEPAVLQLGGGKYYLFYTQYRKRPRSVLVEDPETRAKVLTHRRPRTTIGVALGSPCGANVCWTDMTPTTPLVGFNADLHLNGGSSPSAVTDGAHIFLYYKRNPRRSRVMRMELDPTNLTIYDIKYVTFQTLHPMSKKWQTYKRHQHTGIHHMDVQPYGSGYMMLTNEQSRGVVGRWKSDNGVNFYRFPEDKADMVLAKGSVRQVSAPALEVLGRDDFLVYYAYSDGKDPCSVTRKSVGSGLRCGSAIQARRFKEGEPEKTQADAEENPEQ